MWNATESSPPPSWGRSIAAHLRCDRERGSLRITPTCSAFSLRGYRPESARTKRILKRIFAKKPPLPTHAGEPACVDLPHEGGGEERGGKQFFLMDYGPESLAESGPKG